MEINKIKKGFKAPHSYVLIFVLIVIAALATYVLPAGSFERVVDKATGRTLVVANSFKSVESNPASFLDLFRSIPKGMTDSGWIIFLIFIIGGSFGIITKTIAVEAGIGSAVKYLDGKEKILIPIAVAIFALGGATFGMAESTLIFIPIGVALARALKFDAMVGMAMVTFGANAGFSGGAFNIFTTGVAQAIAGLPLFSGLWLRVITTIVFVIIVSIFTIRYAMKIKNNPEDSIVYDLEQQEKLNVTKTEIAEFTSRRKLVLLVVAVGFGFIIYGVSHGWGTSTDLSAIFLIMGILSGLISGLHPGEIADAFIEGARGLIYGALIVGLCRAIVVLLENGRIIDTIVNSLASIVGLFPPVIAAIFMLVVESLLDFIIGSGSGKAAATMPIMTPLADLVGLTRQTAVLAYQLGDGISNQLWPTSGVLMAGLSIAKIPYEKWLKFAVPLIVLLYVASAIILAISAAIGYGPF
jgi:uncharacterized ion transporter superfamily protein YfcC